MASICFSEDVLCSLVFSFGLYHWTDFLIFSRGLHQARSILVVLTAHETSPTKSASGSVSRLPCEASWTGPKRRGSHGRVLGPFAVKCLRAICSFFFLGPFAGDLQFKGHLLCLGPCFRELDVFRARVTQHESLEHGAKD